MGVSYFEDPPVFIYLTPRPVLQPVHLYLYYMGGPAILHPNLRPARTSQLILYGPIVLHRRWTAGGRTSPTSKPNLHLCLRKSTESQMTDGGRLASQKRRRKCASVQFKYMSNYNLNIYLLIYYIIYFIACQIFIRLKF